MEMVLPTRCGRQFLPQGDVHLARVEDCCGPLKSVRVMSGGLGVMPVYAGSSVPQAFDVMDVRYIGRYVIAARRDVIRIELPCVIHGVEVAMNPLADRVGQQPHNLVDRAVLERLVSRRHRWTEVEP